MQKKPKSQFEDLMGSIKNYIADMEGINEKRIESAEIELGYLNQESIAFNILRQCIYNLEDHGIPEN